MQKNILLGSLLLLKVLSRRYIVNRIFLSKNKPLLLEDLPSNREKAKLEFAQRVDNNLSSISSSTLLAKELTKQGFNINNNQKNKTVAFYKENNIFCSSSWQISWTNIDSDRISELASSYTSRCL